MACVGLMRRTPWRASIMRHWPPGPARRSMTFSKNPNTVEPTQPTPIPTIPACPSPICLCAATPSDLDIDRTSLLANTTPVYGEHVVICTGKNDWASKIEDEKGLNAFRGMRDIMKRYMKAGRMATLTSMGPIMISNSSIPPYSKLSTDVTISTTSAYLFPSFRHVFDMSHDSSGYENFLTNIYKDGHIPQKADGSGPFTRRINDIVVLICGHGGRDKRCGILGPILEDEFSTKLRHAQFTVGSLPDLKSTAHPAAQGHANVALISHIGGHKFAGNVIMYIPPDFKIKGTLSPLAGKGIWYGRVEPKHVEGIIEETVLNGKVIVELFRGGINFNRTPIRL